MSITRVVELTLPRGVPTIGYALTPDCILQRQRQEILHMTLTQHGIEVNINNHDILGDCCQGRTVCEVCLRRFTKLPGCDVSHGAISCMTGAVTLYDNLGYIIGTSGTFDLTGKLQSVKMYGFQKTRLQYGQIVRHANAPEDTESSGSIDVEIKRWRKDMNGHMSMPLGLATNSAELDKVNDYSMRQCFTFHCGDGEVKCEGVLLGTIVKKSEFFRKMVEDYSCSSNTIDIKDVAAGDLQRLVEFMHYGKCVYLETDEGRALQECCRDLLVVADQYMCKEFADECARCLVIAASKKTVFDDITFMETHYHGVNKKKLQVELVKKVKVLKPDNKSEQIKAMLEVIPDMAALLLDDLL